MQALVGLFRESERQDLETTMLYIIFCKHESKRELQFILMFSYTSHSLISSHHGKTHTTQRQTLSPSCFLYKTKGLSKHSLLKREFYNLFIPRSYTRLKRKHCHAIPSLCPPPTLFPKTPIMLAHLQASTNTARHVHCNTLRH